MLGLALAGLAGLAACGRGDSGGALADAQAGLAAVHKGTMDLRLTAGAGAGGGGDVGFRLEGPFDFTGRPGSLPVAKLRMTRLLGGRSEAATFESDGERAFVVRGGRRVALDEADAAGLRLGKASGSSGSGPGPTGLHLSDWAQGEVEEAEAGDGQRRIEANVDAVAVLNDVLGLAGQFGDAGSGGGGVRPLEGKEAERLREAVASAHMTALVGADKRLRSLGVDIVFAPSHDAAAKVRQALGELAAARLSLELTLTPA